jgi:site-specific DNA-cytosine methylase
MGINVLSVFDGISCGQVALQRAGVDVDNYFASEIDKWAIQITQKNHPNTKQLGNVENWADWDLPKIDLLIGGSPCQGFSVAGDRLDFDDPRSKLFFVYADLLRELRCRNPEIKFMLENVPMKQWCQDVISDHLCVQPVEINSALVSAQSRRRLYWANWPISQPEDRGILLKDIIVDGFVDRDKSYAIDANYHKGGSEDYLRRTYHGFAKRQVVKYQSARRLMVQVGTANDINGHDYNKRVYSLDGKSPTLNGNHGGNLEPKVALDDVHYRKLHPIECERLQTLPDGYTKGVSNTQRYRGLGNGWTVDVVAHIFREMNNADN